MYYLPSVLICILICVVCAHVEVGISKEQRQDHIGSRLSEHHKTVRHNKYDHNARHNQRKLSRHRNSHRGLKGRCLGATCDDKNSTNSGSTGIPYILFYNSSSTLLGFYSPSVAVAIVIEYVSGVVLTLDGKFGDTVLIDPGTNKVVSFDKSSPLSWIASKQTFDDFFASINSKHLKDAEEAGNQDGHVYNINDAPEQVQKQVAHVLSNLGEKEAETSGISYVCSLSKRLTNQKNVLKLIINGTGKISTPLNLKQLICVLEGLERVIANCVSSVSQLPPLDLSEILDANSGIEAFLNILKQLGPHIDLAKILGNGLNSIEIFLSFTVRFAADSSNGIDGIFKIIYSLISFISSHGSVTDIVHSVFQFVTNNGINFDRRQIVGVVRAFISIIENQSRWFPNNPFAGAISRFFKGLEDGNLIFNGINISSIIHSLIHLQPQNALRTIINIFIQLGIGLPDLFLNIVRLIISNSPWTSSLGNIIPGLNKDQIPTGPNALRDLLKNANITGAISSGGPITNVIQNIPIIGTIYSAITHASNYSQAFTNFFGPSSPGLNNLLNIVQGFNNPNGGIQGFIGQLQNGINSIIGGNLPFVPANTEHPSPATDGSTSEVISTSTSSPTSDDGGIQFTDLDTGNGSDGLLGRNAKSRSRHFKIGHKQESENHHK